MESLLLSIDEIKKEFDTSYLWFRGHSSTDYKLLPTVLRSKVAETNETALFYEYKSFSSSINGNTKKNWDLLLDMQHYGIPTRLLDWTFSLSTALYFALSGSPSTPCIWVLNPHILNRMSTGADIIYDISTVPDLGGHSGYTAAKIIVGESGFELPYAIRPPYTNSRIAAQRGTFTVHTKSNLPIEEICPSALKKITIDPELIDKYKSYLTNLSIDELSLFPDQAGLASYLKTKYKLEI